MAKSKPAIVPLEFKDGLDAMRSVMSVREVMSLIERTARWVDPETFKLLPMWYPELARGRPLYKANWTERMTNTRDGVTSDKSEGNGNAMKALTLALGLRNAERPNWTCCHIWGRDDPSYRDKNLVVQDRRFFSCVANMVMLPTPLKAFTDHLAEVKTMLRLCARNLYNWSCDHESIASLHGNLDAWSVWEDYPKSWPRKPGDPAPMGMVPINERIRVAAAKRLRDIYRNQETAGPLYPGKEVRQALRYWKIPLKG
jgi:hypothetical protein